MKELSDEEMQSVEGGAGSWGGAVTLNTNNYKFQHNLYPKRSLVKGADGVYTYDNTKVQRKNFNNKGKLTAYFGKSTLQLKLGSKVHNMVHCKIEGVGEGYVNVSVQKHSLTEAKIGDGVSNIPGK